MRLLNCGLLFLTFCSSVMAGLPWEAKDLLPVTMKAKPRHAPVVLVKDGQARASIVVMNRAVDARDLQKYTQQATGAEMPIVSDKLQGPAIVLGDCPEAAALGLDGRRMPPEGFAIKTSADRVFIVGNNSGRKK